MAIKFRKGLESERIQLSGGTYNKPDHAEPLWVTDTQKFYIGNGTGGTSGGILIGPISDFSELSNTAHTHNYVSSGTDVSFDHITATSIITTGASIRTTSLTANTMTANTLFSKQIVISGDGGQSKLTFKGSGSDVDINVIHAAGSILYLPTTFVGNITGSNLVSTTITGTSVSATNYYCGSTNLSTIFVGGSSSFNGTINASQVTGGTFGAAVSGSVISAGTYYSGNNDLLNVLSPSGHSHPFSAFSALQNTGHTHFPSSISGTSLTTTQATFGIGWTNGEYTNGVHWFPGSVIFGGKDIYLNTSNMSNETQILFQNGAFLLHSSGTAGVNHQFRWGPSGASTVLYGDVYAGKGNIYLGDPIAGLGASNRGVNVGGSGIYFGTGASNNITYQSTPIQISASTTFIAPTITATTYCGITAAMVHGSTGITDTNTPYRLGTYSGDSVFGVGNHFFIDNSFATGLNPTIYYQVTGNTKWGIEVSGSAPFDMQFYAVNQPAGPKH